MPKSAGRRKRIRAARSEAAPTALAPAATSEGGAAAAPKKSAAQSGKGAGGGSASKDKEQQLLPVVQKLKSTEASERLWSTSAISHILGASDSSTRRLLQSNNVVALLIGLLADPESQIQNEACGALRNLAIEGGFEVCAEMFNKSIVPALAKQLETIDGALTKVLAGAPAANDEEKNVHKLLWPWIENLSTLFWCLAETSDKAFKAVVAQSSLSTLLYTLLRRAIPADGSPASSSKVPLSAALAAAQAVYVLTDTNVPSAPKFPLPRDVSLSAAYSNTRSMLLELLRNTGDVTNGGETMAMFRILVIGVLQNLAQSQVHGKQALAGPGEKAEYASLALSALTSSLNSVDLMAEADATAGVHAKLPVASNGGTQGKATSSEAVDASAQKVQLDKVEQRWTRTRLSLEILGELVAELDGIVDVGLLGSEEYEEWGGISGQNGKGDGDEDADVMEQDGKDVKHAAANGTNGTTGPSALSAGTFSVFADLPKILLGLAQPTCISFAAASAAPASGSNAASSQLISTEPVGNAPAAAPSGPASNATYVPILSELASLIHSRALECLNNLLITIGRSVSEAPAASPSGDVLQVDGVDDSLALLAEEDGQDEAMAGDDDEDVEEAGSDEGDVEEAMLAATEPQPDSGAPSYVSANLPSLQTAWETLFQLLVGYINVLQTQMQSKTSAATATANANAVKLAGKKKAGAAAAATSAQGEEPASLCIEACLGSVWALSRLCVDQLTVGKDEVSVLLGVLEASQSGSIDADSAVRCVGALGVLASRTRVSVEENKLIGSALLARMTPLAGASTPNSSDSECLTQILDSLIDVYSDERRAYDAPVFVEGNFLRTLEGAVAPYRKLVKGIDRRKHPELREAANAVATNLGDFVAYRKSLKL